MFSLNVYHSVGTQPGGRGRAEIRLLRVTAPVLGVFPHPGEVPVGPVTRDEVGAIDVLAQRIPLCGYPARRPRARRDPTFARNGPSIGCIPTPWRSPGRSGHP